MAVSPAPLYVADFHEDPSWALGEVSPLTPAYCEQTPSTCSEPPAMKNTCSFDEITSLINSCAKAKVIAVLAMTVFVYDAKLDKRDRWACPLPNCKDGFTDKKDLMRHVLNCSHPYGDQFYCSCCCEYRNIFDQSPNHHVGCRDGGVSSNDKGSTTSKAMRKLSQIFTRSRSASRSSSRASWQLVGSTPSPSSAACHQNVRSMVNGTPSYSGDSRKQSVAYPSELPVISTPPSESQAEKNVDHSVPCELYDPSSENRVSELPSSDHSVDSTTGYPPQPIGPVLSTINTAFPMFTGAERFTESPEEDIAIDSQIPDPSFHQGDDMEILPEYSHIQYPSIGAGQFAPQPSQDQHHPSWNSSGESVSLFPFDGQQHQNCAQDVLYTLPGTSVDSHVGVSSFCADPYLQQGAPSSSEQSISSQSRHGSGDSYLSVASRNAPMSGQFQVLGPHHSRGSSRMYGVLSESSSNYVAAPSNSPPSEMEDYHCPYCSYRPGGDVSHRKAYLKKHITNKHVLGPVPCPDCGKEISRMDNLKTHQKNSCKKAFNGFWQSVALGRNSVDSAYHHAPKRRRQGSRGW
ncbi:hypothetical protein FSARC_1834 [Fusarium sarcochroum]|uniref:C2H2-type domain-containing protein n=1 Tax=Fusarium sarcochroum TaxID=1208366 RepID=A0A8H4XEE1_9HYPO|nr:hypothetical protein FSARC_1834 [Fusarium sarcochroum]